MEPPQNPTLYHHVNTYVIVLSCLKNAYVNGEAERAGREGRKGNKRRRTYVRMSVHTYIVFVCMHIRTNMYMYYTEYVCAVFSPEKNQGIWGVACYRTSVCVNKPPSQFTVDSGIRQIAASLLRLGKSSCVHSAHELP